MGPWPTCQCKNFIYFLGRINLSCLAFFLFLFLFLFVIITLHPQPFQVLDPNHVPCHSGQTFSQQECSRHSSSIEHWWRWRIQFWLLDSSLETYINFEIRTRTKHYLSCLPNISRKTFSKLHQDQDHVTTPLKMFEHYHLRNSEWNPSLLLFTLEALPLQCYIHLPLLHQPRKKCQILLYSGASRLQPNTYLHQLNSITVLEPPIPPKPKNPWKQTRPKTASEKFSTTSASPANSSAKFTTHSLLINTSTAWARAWEQEAFLCTYRFGATGHVGAISTQPSQLKLHYRLF